MNSPYQIGITGGIGSGKSTVATIFACLGVPVYDADNRAKHVMATDPILIAQIRKEFGELAFDPKGNLNRKFLADQVFGFPERLERLNNLVHPRVAEDYLRWVSEQNGKHYTLKEAALLFESGSAKQLDKIVVVTAPEALRIKRVMNRDKRREQDVKNIIGLQWTDEQSLALADYVITNDETVAVLPQVLQTHQSILAMIQAKRG